MNNRSIAFQLSIYISVAVVLIMAAGIYLNYTFSKKIIIEQIEENGVHQSEKVISGIAHYVVTAQEVSRNLSFQVEEYEHQGRLEDFLKDILTRNPVISGFRVEFFDDSNHRFLGVLNKGNGEFQIVNTEEQCVFPQSKEIKAQVQQQAQGVWSEPYFCPLDTSLLVVSFTKPVYNSDDDIIGFISSQLNLDFLGKAVDNIKIKGGGRVIILSEDGYFLTNSDRSYIMKKTIFDISEKVFPFERGDYENLIRSHQRGSGYAYPDIMNYQKAWFHFAPVPYTYWTIVIAIPEKEFFADLHVMLRKYILISVVGLVIIVFMIYFIFHRMLSPLAAIAKSIKRISSDDIRISDQKNEIQLLTSSLSDLQLRYSQYVNEQNQNRKDRRKIEKDLKSAKEIQTAIIPSRFKFDPKRPQVDLFASLNPAETIGGDLFDYFYVDKTHLLFTIGDVSGKGIPAALFMAVASTLIRSKSAELEPSKIIEQVNNELSLQNSNQSFITLFLGILDIETGEICYCNAAHNYPYILTMNGKIRSLDKTHGLPIGVYSSKPYSGDIGILSAGDRLILYTDGVTDCKNARDEFFGDQNLRESISKLPNLSAEDTAEFLLEELDNFRGAASQFDDLSLMVLKFNGTK